MKFHHLKDIGESYFEHMGFSLKICVLLGVLSYAALIHAIFPFCFADTVSTKLNNIVKAMEER
jgi:hypothetical protein|tara:strand:- start:224 stop:412 length:189 start_codon:yes stop_codon:yes gene_type:complete